MKRYQLMWQVALVLFAALVVAIMVSQWPATKPPASHVYTPAPVVTVNPIIATESHSGDTATYAVDALLPAHIIVTYQCADTLRLTLSTYRGVAYDHTLPCNGVNTQPYPLSIVPGEYSVTVQADGDWNLMILSGITS